MTIGVIVPWMFDSVPALWSLCDGSIYNISQFPAAGALLGSTHGGDGVTTFGVPLIRDRMIKAAVSNGQVGTVQAGRAGTTTPVTANALFNFGASGGSSTLLSSATYTFSSDNTHSHSYLALPPTVDPAIPAGFQHILQTTDLSTAVGHANESFNSGVGLFSHQHTVPQATTNSTANHTHTVAFSSQTASHVHLGNLTLNTSFEPEGGGQPIPRTFSIRWIIKLAEP
ncbi:phage tail protein [Synechococcus elongatus IITB4]|uniref:phage tail protein n=1 Tax=Synechococcus elongatus TaxID=32046 RepID=UPI0030D0085C